MEFNEPTRSKKQPKKAILLWVGALILLAGVGYGFYALYAAQNRNSNEVAELRDEIKGLNAKLDQSNKTEDKASETAKAGKLAIVGGVSGFHLDTEFISSRGNDITYGKDVRGYNTLYVDVTIQNKGNADSFVSPDLFKLKDESGKTYALHTEKMREREELSGKQELQSQKLAAGEQVSGTLGFQVPPSLTKTSLYLGDQTVPVQMR